MTCASVLPFASSGLAPMAAPRPARKAVPVSVILAALVCGILLALSTLFAAPALALLTP